MSAYDHLPLIDPKTYFDDPSIPDGNNIGFVSPQGIVFREGVPVGRDKTHPNYAPKPGGLAILDSAINRLRQQVEAGDVGSAAQNGVLPSSRDREDERNRPGATFQLHPKRTIEQLYDGGVTIRGSAHVKVAVATDGTIWLLADQAWFRLLPANLPPLPQE